MGDKIKELRRRTGMIQKDLAAYCGVTQPSIVRWESGADRPTEKAFMRLAELAGSDKWWWLEQAGMRREKLGLTGEAVEMIQVPLFKDRISAGPGWVINENNIDRYLTLSPELFPHGHDIKAARVVGDSMIPLIQPGFIVFIDTSDRDHRKLVKKMVAAREGDEITIKWLRQEGKFYQLVPEHPTDQNRVRILTADKDVAVIGRIIMWIGSPDQYK
ncbi:MAG TPA: XRE family transcriptional regulator [Candidatus Angelobacter sp.]|nr:XRE family transcriptional regulator [Candidatus Angelobacter sp.]